jgi:integrase
MRVRLKGINSYTTKLADGTTQTYWYAWKGGPRLKGKPGTPEFIASYNEAVTRKVKTPSGLLLFLLQGYQASEDFRQLARRTREDYARIIQKEIEPAFSDLPLSTMTDRGIRGEFKQWRDRLALKSRRQADYAWTVLARVLSWSKDRGHITTNPCERGGRIYRGSRADKIWTDADVATFFERAPAHLHLPLTLALWTGQRQGDLLRLTWSAYDGTHIRLKQSKTGRRVLIPVGTPLKTALDEVAKYSPTILLNSDGRPWTQHGFRASWGKACKRSGVVGVTFNDLRGTAVTRLFLAGCNEAEVATITGHSLSDVRSILDAHYLHRDPALGESAIRKLERRTDSSK